MWKILSKPFSWLPWPSKTQPRPKASQQQKGPKKAISGLQIMNEWCGYSHYAGEITKESGIITCLFDRWLEPDCEPAIIAVPPMGTVYAFTNAGCWNNKSGKFKRCRDTDLFDEFPEDIKETDESFEKLMVRMDCMRALDDAVAGLQKDSKALAGDFSTVFKDLNASLTDMQDTLNGPNTKTGSQISFGEGGSSSDVITRDIRSRINNRLAKAKDRINRASSRIHTFERTFDFHAKAHAKKTGSKK